MADDVNIQEHIKGLIDEEHRLRGALQVGDITPGEEQARLGQLEVELDRCWDLLRQRRAKREFGEDPDEAQVRAPGIVENYLARRLPSRVSTLSTGSSCGQSAHST